MRIAIAALMFFISATAFSLVAQTRTVTNADLEKYRQERLAAERDYRDNYERLGMPSPAELEKRREQSRLITEQLSDKLRAAELERERLDVLRDTYEQQSITYSQVSPPINGYGPAYYWSYGNSYRLPRPQYKYQSGYVGGGTFWPTGSRTPSQPVFRRVRR